MPRPRQPAIVGVYQTKQARTLPGRTSQDLVIEAVKGAIADAGLKPRDVDGAAVDWPGPGGAPRDAENWAMYLQQPLSWSSATTCTRPACAACSRPPPRSRRACARSPWSAAGAPDLSSGSDTGAGRPGPT